MWHFGPATPADRSGRQKQCGQKSHDTLCNPSLIFNSCQWRHLGWRSSLFWDFPFLYRSICNIWNCVIFVNKAMPAWIYQIICWRKKIFYNGCQMRILYLHSTGYCHYFGTFLPCDPLLSALIYCPFTKSFYVATHKQYPVCTSRYGSATNQLS